MQQQLDMKSELLVCNVRIPVARVSCLACYLLDELCRQAHFKCQRCQHSKEVLNQDGKVCWLEDIQGALHT
jgi:hypothetical protein